VRGGLSGDGSKKKARNAALYLSSSLGAGGETPQTYLLNLSDSFENMAATAMELVITGQTKHDIGIKQNNLAELTIYLSYLHQDLEVQSDLLTEILSGCISVCFIFWKRMYVYLYVTRTVAYGLRLAAYR
jgi:hypothetical protein